MGSFEYGGVPADGEVRLSVVVPEIAYGEILVLADRAGVSVEQMAQRLLVTSVKFALERGGF